MAKSVINVVINAKTLGTDQVQKLEVELTGVQLAAQKAATGLAKMDFHKTVTACGALSASLNGLVSSLDFATEGYRSFDAAMRAANTMAGKDAAGFEQMKGQITELGKQIPLTRDALANGLYQTISNGVPEDNWVSFLEESARSAVGGMADLGGVVTVTSTIIKNYGLAWDEAVAIQDKIQTTAKNGVTSFEQLQQALPRVTGNAATLGVSIDELMASFATLTGVSGNTAEVSTQLAAIFTALVKPSSEAGKMAEAMGIQFDAAAIKAAGGFQNFITQLDKSVKAYAKASGTLEQEVYGKLFGSAESLRALIPLTGELASKYAENVAAMEGSTGAIDAAFADMAQTADSKAQLMKNAWADATDVVGKAAGKLKPTLDFGAAFGQFTSGSIAVSAAASKACKSITAMAANMRNASAGANALAKANTALRASMLALPYAGVIAGITAGVAATYKMLDVTSKARKVNDEHRKAMEALAKTEESLNIAAEQACSAELARVSVLIRVIGDETQSRKARQAALDEAKQKYPDYFKDLNLEQASVSTLAETYDSLRKNIIAAAKARAAESKVAELTSEQLAAQDRLENIQSPGGEIEKTRIALAEANANLKDNFSGIYSAGTGTAGGSASMNSGYAANLTARNELQNKLNGLLAEEETLTERIAEYQVQINKYAGKAAESMAKESTRLPSGGIGGGGGTGSGKGKDKTPAPAGSLKHIEDQISDLNAKLKVSVDEESRIELYKQIQALEDQKHVIEFKYEFPNAPDRPDSSAPSMFGQIETDIAKLNPQLEDVASKIENTTGKAKASAEDAAGAFANLGSSIAGLGNAVELPALNIAGTMMQAIANMVLAFSTAQTQSAALGPFGWMAFAATGLAQLTSMVASVKSLPAFADGGIAYGPTLGLFGEYAGAANNPEVVAPLDRLQSMIQPAGGAVAVTGTFRIRGRDLVAMIGNETSIASKSGKHTNIKL